MKLMSYSMTNMRRSNSLPKRVAIALFASAYIYFFFVVSVIVREGSGSTRRMLSGVPGTDTTLAINPRAFEPKDFPCFLEDQNAKWWEPAQNEDHTQGFFFLKTHKTGSSTAAGIHLRMARNVAARLTARNQKKRKTKEHDPMCRVQYEHSQARKMKYGDRSKLNSLLWTLVREPTERAISQFFHFEVSRKGNEPTDENFASFLSSKKFRRWTDSYYYIQLSMEEYDSNQYNMAAKVQQILNDYDFIGVTERMDDSVVALQLLLGLSTADVLYLNDAKASGSFDAGGYQGKCTYIQPKNVTEGMIDFLKSPQWAARVRWDRLLWEAANKSLDLTIDTVIGRDRFEHALAKFQKGQEMARKQCLDGGNSTAVRFPCSADRVGKPPLDSTETDCLWKDSGCGFTCLDRVADQLGLWESEEEIKEANVVDFQGPEQENEETAPFVGPVQIRQVELQSVSMLFLLMAAVSFHFGRQMKRRLLS